MIAYGHRTKSNLKTLFVEISVLQRRKRLEQSGAEWRRKGPTPRKPNKCQRQGDRPIRDTRRHRGCRGPRRPVREAHLQSRSRTHRTKSGPGCHFDLRQAHKQIVKYETSNGGFVMYCVRIVCRSFCYRHHCSSTATGMARNCVAIRMTDFKSRRELRETGDTVVSA